MRLRAALAALFTAASVLAAATVLSPGAAADDGERLRIAKDLVKIAIDDEVRGRIQEQLVVLLTRSIGLSLENQLNRRLLEGEWRNIEKIVMRFIAYAMPTAEIEQVYARVYANLFDEDELRELARFNQTPAGRKSLRLRGQIGEQALQSMAQVVERSPERKTLAADLKREFPVLGPAESP